MGVAGKKSCIERQLCLCASRAIFLRKDAHAIESRPAGWRGAIQINSFGQRLIPGVHIVFLSGK